MIKTKKVSEGKYSCLLYTLHSFFVLLLFTIIVTYSFLYSLLIHLHYLSFTLPFIIRYNLSLMFYFYLSLFLVQQKEEASYSKQANPWNKKWSDATKSMFGAASSERWKRLLKLHYSYFFTLYLIFSLREERKIKRRVN